MSTELTVAGSVTELQKLLERYKSQIEMVIPKHLTPERMIRVAMTAYSRTPMLRECTSLSIVACVIQASELGLDLTGPLGQAYMVPFYNKHIKRKEATFIVGYRGFIALAYRSGMVKTFHPHEVREKDTFDFCYGTEPKILHRPLKSGNRGEVTHVYAVLLTKDGGIDFEVMSRDDVEAHRKQYSKQREDGAFNPWNNNWSEMAKKTPIRRLFKRAPVSIEAQIAAELDERADFGIPQDLPLLESSDLAPGAPEGTTNLRGNGAPQGRLDRVRELINTLGMSSDAVSSLLRQHGAHGINQLTAEQAEAVIKQLEIEVEASGSAGSRMPERIEV